MPTAETIRREAHREDEDIDIRSFIAELGGGQDIVLKLARKSPRIWKGVEIGGAIGTYDDPIDEDFVRERFGGGKYYLQVMKRNDKGQLKFFTAKTFTIAGPPKLDEYQENLVAAVPGGAAEPSTDGSVAGQAMAAMQWMTKNALEEKKAAERERSTGFDPGLVQLIQGPVIEQVRAMQDSMRQLQAQLAAKDERILELVTRKPDDSGATFQNRMLEKMVDGESARIESLRANHDSELRQLKAQHLAELERERDRLKEDMRSREKQHERELEAIKESHKMASDGQKLSWETRVDGLKAEVKRLQDDLAQAKTELGELRARKEKSLPEQAKEIAQIQEALQAIGVGGKEEEDKSVFERIVGSVMENPEAIGQIIGGVRGGPSPQEQEAQAQQAQAMQMAQAQQAQRIAQVRAAKKRRRILAAQAAMASQQGGAGGAGADGASAPEGAEGEAPTNGAAPVAPPQPVSVSRDDMRIAVTFMESAIVANTSPETFAASARAAIPGDLLDAIGKSGVDAFLHAAKQMGAIGDGSPLSTQRGRNFAREVTRHLLAPA